VKGCFKMTLAWGHTISSQVIDSESNIEASEGNDPVCRTNKTVKHRCLTGCKKFRIVFFRMVSMIHRGTIGSKSDNRTKQNTDLVPFNR
jgi:hypothetical protein